VNYFSTPGMRWVRPDGHEADVFPEIKGGGLLSQSVAQVLFRSAPKTWEAMLRDATDSKSQAFALPVTIRLHTVSRSREVSSPNVAAVLPGSDPKLKDEYVVYTAHSDHMGIGKAVNGDAIYNGAGDNASGVAALLEIARAFRSLPNPPARSILFLAVTAEEMGLLGSDYFAHSPTVPMQSIVANVNMDEASISYAFKDIIARGAPDSTLGRIVERAASPLGLKVSPDPQPEQGYFTRSDQYSFVKQGIPSVGINEGYEAKDPKVDGKKVTGEWAATRYH
jgi:Zn-dependent M28 family amino/carboxypeptidase